MDFPKGYVEDLNAETIAKLREAIPTHLLAGLDRYVSEHKPTGGFLTSVLENDLSGAFTRCATDPLDTIKPLLSYFFGCLPAPCWGSPARVKAWLSTRSDPKVWTEAPIL